MQSVFVAQGGPVAGIPSSRASSSSSTCCTFGAVCSDCRRCGPTFVHPAPADAVHALVVQQPEPLASPTVGAYLVWKDPAPTKVPLVDPDDELLSAARLHVLVWVRRGTLVNRTTPP
jgi:hypothetical protein